MVSRQPGATVLAAAFPRAAQQIWKQGRIFHDPLAVTVLGEDAEIFVRGRPRNIPAAARCGS
jgi:hypothetical protein